MWQAYRMPSTSCGVAYHHRYSVWETTIIAPDFLTSLLFINSLIAKPFGTKCIFVISCALLQLAFLISRISNYCLFPTTLKQHPYRKLFDQIENEWLLHIWWPLHYPFHFLCPTYFHVELRHCANEMSSIALCGVITCILGMSHAILHRQYASGVMVWYWSTAIIVLHTHTQNK